MLYILNKSSTAAFEQLAVIGTDDTDKIILFVLDAVFLTSEEHIKHLRTLNIDAFYADKEALEARIVGVADDVILVDYDEMTELLEDADKIITL